MSTPFFDLIEELRTLAGAPKVTYPTGDNNYPQTERTIKARRGSHILALGTPEPDATRFPNNVLTDQIELRADAQIVEVYRKYEVLPGPFTRQGQEYDPQYGMLATYTEGEVRNGAAVGTARSDITPENYVKSVLRTWTIPTAALDAFYLTFPGTESIEFPRVLAGLIATWDIGTGMGNFTETGTGFASGSSASLSIALEGSGQGSGSVLGDLSPVYAPQPPSNLPVLDYFFFLPNPVTLSAILTRCTQIATALAGTATTVNQWPVFMLQEHTFIVVGQKLSVSARATAKCAVSLSAGSVSENLGSGMGTNEDVGSSVKAITIPGCIHGAISITGSTMLYASANASASAMIQAGVNWPGASSTSGETRQAVGYITPTSIAATPQTGLPASGLYLYKPDVQPYKWGYSAVRGRIFDFGVLSGTVSLGQPQITTVDFHGLTGANFVKSAVQITTVDFTGLTGANFVTQLPQITTFDFTGLTGAHFVTSAPQITTVDFTGLTGAGFVTGSAGKGFSLPSAASGTFGVWFNTGTETQPTIGGATTYVEVTITSTATASALATALAAAFSSSSIWTVGAAAAVATFTSVAFVSQSDAADVNSGAAIAIPQSGSQNEGLAFVFPSATSGTFGVWFNTGTETQPTLSAATYIQVSISPTASASAIAAALVTAFAGQTAIWTSASTGAVATFTSVAKVAQTNASDFDSGAAITVTQKGSASDPGDAFLLPSSSPFLGTFGVWFDTGTELAPTLSTSVATYIQVSISPTATASDIAAALAAAFSGQTALWTVAASSATTTFTSVSVAAQGEASDVDTGAAIAVTQHGGAVAGNYFLIYGYQSRGTAIWFNAGNEIAPAVLGTTIGVPISPTASAADLAAAIVAAVPAAVGAVWVMAQINGGGANTAVRFTAVPNETTAPAADVNTGAAVTTVQSGQPPNV